MSKLRIEISNSTKFVSAEFSVIQNHNEKKTKIHINSLYKNKNDVIK